MVQVEHRKASIHDPDPDPDPEPEPEPEPDSHPHPDSHPASGSVVLTLSEAAFA